jgi:transposase-like protein
MPRPFSAPVSRALRQARWSASDARLILDALTSSGLTIPEFAREHRVDAQRLYVWRRRLATPARKDAPIAFVQLQTPAPQAHAPARYELLLSSGETLRIEGGVVAADLTILLTALRGGRSC